MLEALLSTTKVSAPGGNGETALLMHFENNYNDEVGHIFTQSGTVQTPGYQAKFGTNAVSFTGQGSLATPDAPDLRLNGTTGDWTIEGFIWVASADFNQNTALMGKGPQAWIQFYSGYLYLHTDAGTYTVDATISTANVWHHFAITQGAGVQQIFIDGVMKKSVSASAQFGNNAAALVLGSSAGYAMPFKGYLDELRISRSRIYTANFTPPTAPFTL